MRVLGRPVAKGGKGPCHPPAKPELFMGCGLQICQKCIGGRDSAPDPTGGAHVAPPDLLGLVGWVGGHQSQCPTPSAPQFSRHDATIGASILVPRPADLELATVLVLGLK